MLPEDIITRVRQDFTEDDAVVILQLLKELKERKFFHGLLGDRVLRCIVFVAKGNFEKFADAVYCGDYRDLIIQAEYDGWMGEEHRIRNFEFPFSKNPS